MGDNANRVPPTKEPMPSLPCPMLTDTNYTVWAMKMKVIFKVYKVWDVIDPGTTIDIHKDSIAIALLFQGLPEELVLQIGNNDSAKEMWEAVKSRNQGAERVKEARLQTLMSEFEGLKMKEPSTIAEFAGKISGIASRSASLGTVIKEEKLVKRFLHGLPKRFIHMVASLEQSLNLKTVGFDDVVGRLIAYEERVNLEDNEQQVRSDQLLLTYEEWEARKKEGCDRGKGTTESSQRGRGRGRGKIGGQDKDKEPNQKPKKDRSKIRCFRCDELGHFSSDCSTRKKDEDEEEENNLIQRVEPVLYLQTHFQETNDVFLDEERIIPRMYASSPSELNTWFLDNGASNHMTGKKEWFTNLDHNIKGKVKFGDGSCVEIKGQGMVILEGKSGEQRVLRDVYYIPALESNIISIGQLDERGYKIAIQDGILWMFEQDGTLLMKVPRSPNRIYKINLVVVSPVCIQTKDDKAENSDQPVSIVTEVSDQTDQSATGISDQSGQSATQQTYSDQTDQLATESDQSATESDQPVTAFSDESATDQFFSNSIGKWMLGLSNEETSLKVENLLRDKIKVEHVSGDLQRADILTKVLARLKFIEMRGLIGVTRLGG
ncbi:putative RNA-directed DNA polymerase [Helianthus annuus]|nr:putative RNA-directed DNA polymerase [Helianthus annuus]KAJ0926430.1 putative RNA-directed DNA polymerase [Helianthus annuus]